MNLWWRLVKFGFRLLYNEMAFTYDWVSKVVSFGAWRCWQRAALKHVNVEQGALILELAHGTGDLQLDIHAAGYRSVGYDLSPYMGQITTGKMRRRGLVTRLTRGMAQNLPYADRAFDAVVCTFPTNFVFEAATLREVWRVVKPGGRFVIVVNGVFATRGAGVAALEWLYRITGQRPDGYDETDQVQASQALEGMLDFFRQHGFETRILHEPCPRSYAQVIVAEKLR